MPYLFIFGLSCLVGFHIWINRMMYLIEEEEKKTARERRRERLRERRQQRNRQSDDNLSERSERQRERPRREESAASDERRRSSDRDRDRERPKSRAEEQRLDRDFEADIENLERSICCYDFREKSIATEWIVKLRASNRSYAEKRARNDITAHLLKCSNQGVFRSEPFNSSPPAYSVAQMRDVNLLPLRTTCNNPTDSEKQKHLNEIFEDSYDKGEFLSEMPVPRNGSFYIVHMRPNDFNSDKL